MAKASLSSNYAKNDDKSIPQFMTLSESPRARMTYATSTQPVAESISRQDSDLIPMFIVVTNYVLLPTAHSVLTLLVSVNKVKYATAMYSWVRFLYGLPNTDAPYQAAEDITGLGYHHKPACPNARSLMKSKINWK